MIQLRLSNKDQKDTWTLLFLLGSLNPGLAAIEGKGWQCNKADPCCERSPQVGSLILRMGKQMLCTDMAPYWQWLPIKLLWLYPTCGSSPTSQDKSASRPAWWQGKKPETASQAWLCHAGKESTRKRPQPRKTPFTYISASSFTTL